LGVEAVLIRGVKLALALQKLTHMRKFTKL